MYIRLDHDDFIKWKHFPRYWPFVRGIHRSLVNSPHKGQWRGALVLSLICAWINGWVNNREAGDLRRHSAHYDVTLTIHSLALRNHQRESPCRGREGAGGWRLEVGLIPWYPYRYDIIISFIFQSHHGVSWNNSHDPRSNAAVLCQPGWCQGPLHHW